jgi:hypothetical protein
MNGKTSWWEVKHATPKVTGTGVQHLTARRLAAAGDCWYIVYRSPTDKDGSNAAMTCLVRPQDIGENGYFKMVDDAHQCYGYDHRFVLAFIKKVHGVQ